MKGRKCVFPRNSGGVFIQRQIQVVGSNCSRLSLSTLLLRWTSTTVKVKKGTSVRFTGLSFCYELGSSMKFQVWQKKRSISLLNVFVECSKCSMFMLINNVSNHAFRSPSRASANMCLVCKWQVQAIVAVWSMLAQLLFLQRPPNPTRQLKSHTTGPHRLNMQDFLLIMHYAALTLFSHPAKQWNIQLALTVTHISNSPKKIQFEKQVSTEHIALINSFERALINSFERISDILILKQWDMMVEF